MENTDRLGLNKKADGVNAVQPNVSSEALEKLGELHRAGVLHRLGVIAGLGAVHHADQREELGRDLRFAGVEGIRKEQDRNLLALLLGAKAIHHEDERKFGLLAGAKDLHQTVERFGLAEIAKIVLLKKTSESTAKIPCQLKAIAVILGATLILAIVERAFKHGLASGIFAGATIAKGKALGAGLVADALHHHKD